MDPSEGLLKGTNGGVDQPPKESGNQVVGRKAAWNRKGLEEKKAAVDEEISRMNKLPPNSTYATHRLRVLNKILHLLSMQRTTSQEEELELLFAGLSL
ncbi:uncharacterized protein LOC113775427 [Coffea eugenioides]|uniref:uncharacterized protein LOC113775427 n=1 Tax=Coffea eugenioides TaxID=49369 RepID=UPI000F60A00C|nr:uncharacterized protein LOC113775427 [Coffea eugenioides]XP_027176102.1 uncharacterized protein LOC113775427 [Coffea eugenioides]